MSTILCSCPDCGDIEVTDNDMKVITKESDDKSFYRFTCTKCNTIVLRDAEPRIVQLLIASGVLHKRWDDRAAEMDEIRERWQGENAAAPITHNDAIEFHKLLDGQDWLKHFLGEAVGHLDLTDEVTNPEDTIEQLVQRLGEFDHHLNVLRQMLPEGTGDDYYETLIEALRDIYLAHIDFPPEHDPRADGPGGDIKNV
ncbi:MAG: hypothetical protein U0520_01765 [Candidatus Saccharimonadales bacterium]